MPTLNMGTELCGDFEGTPYWKQPSSLSQAYNLPPPAQAAAALRKAGDSNIFAPSAIDTHTAPLRDSIVTCELKTATVGTDAQLSASNDDGSDYFERARDGPNLNLATVAGHMLKLQRLLKNDGQPIQIDAFELIAEVSDMVDQIFYWGISESRFPERPFSALCECEVIETLTPLLENDRPTLVMAALKALTSVLQHPLSCKHFAKRDASFKSLFVALTRFPARAELVADAIAVCRGAAPGNVEEFLVSDCLSGVIAGMQRHTDHLEIQKCGAMLFSDLIGMPRIDLENVPIGILFVHIGQIVDFVIAAAEQQSTSSDVSDSVLHFFEVATRYPQNILKLMGKKQFLPTIEELAKRGVGARSSESVVSALAVISNIIPALSLKQKMRVSSVVRDVMIKTTDIAVLMACFALQHTLLVSSRSLPPRLPIPPQSEASDADVPEAAELTLTRPVKDKSVAASVESEESLLRREYEELKLHMTDEQIPQCIMIAMDHFGLQGDPLHEAGSAAVREMALRRLHWQQ